MKKVIRLTESDLMRIVRRVIKENNASERYDVIDIETGKMVGTNQDGVGFTVNKIGERMGYESDPVSIPNGTKIEDNDNSPMRRYNDLNENDDYDDDYTRERSFKDKNFKSNKSGLERTIERIDSVEQIIKLLGGEDFTAQRLRYYKPLGLTSVDELVNYKGGYEEDEY